MSGVEELEDTPHGDILVFPQSNTIYSSSIIHVHVDAHTYSIITKFLNLNVLSLQYCTLKCIYLYQSHMHQHASTWN